jgi:hypothetical protein
METIQSRTKQIGILTTVAALMIVLVLGWYLRYQASMTTELIPGINGAYYPLQVRSILETGGLGIPDFPLLFYVNAAFALLLSIFMELNEAVVLATRLVDLVVPVLIAVPVMLFAFEFSQDRRKSYLVGAATLLIGVVAVANTSLLRMSGDFQKNAVALPFSLTFLYFLYRSFSHQMKRDYLLAALFFAITCLTHLGVTALTLTAGGFYSLIALASHPNRRKAFLIAGSMLLIALLVLTVVYLYDSTRIERLLSVVLEPDNLFSPLDGDDSPNNKQMGSNFFDDRLLLGNILGILGIVLTITLRHSTDNPTRTLLWAASLTALLFASPVISPAWSQRLALMAFLPGLIPLVFLVMRTSWGWVSALGVAVFVVATTLTSPGVFTQKTLTSEAYDELVEMKDFLEDGETLVFAEHGLEWWVAWTMETEITNRYYLAAQAWDEYDAVYILQQTNPAAFSTGKIRPARANAPNETTPTSPSRPGQSPGMPQNQVQGSNLIYDGEYFALSQIEEQPVMLRGGGEPSLEGELEEIIGSQLTVEGQTLVINSATTFSIGNQEITTAELETGSRILVWGDWEGLFDRKLNASYITVIPTNQFNPGSIRPGQPPGGPNQQPQPGSPPQSGQDPQADVVQLGPLNMVTRAGWGAEPVNLNARLESGEFNPENNPTGVLTYPQPLAEWLTTIVVHHSALPVEQGPLEIQTLHMEKAGYADIGYHFIVGHDGTLYEGRPLQTRGAHTEGFNTGTVGIVLLGNFENSDPTTAQLLTLNQLIRFFKNRYQITHLAGHQDFNPEITVCPGETLYALLPEIADRAGLIYGTSGYQAPPWDSP